MRAPAWSALSARLYPCRRGCPCTPDGNKEGNHAQNSNRPIDRFGCLRARLRDPGREARGRPARGARARRDRRRRPVDPARRQLGLDLAPRAVPEREGAGSVARLGDAGGQVRSGRDRVRRRQARHASARAVRSRRARQLRGRPRLPQRGHADRPGARRSGGGAQGQGRPRRDHGDLRWPAHRRRGPRGARAAGARRRARPPPRATRARSASTPSRSASEPAGTAVPAEALEGDRLRIAPRRELARHGVGDPELPARRLSRDRAPVVAAVDGDDDGDGVLEQQGPVPEHAEARAGGRRAGAGLSRDVHFETNSAEIDPGFEGVAQDAGRGDPRGQPGSAGSRRRAYRLARRGRLQPGSSRSGARRRCASSSSTTGSTRAGSSRAASASPSRPPRTTRRRTCA